MPRTLIILEWDWESYLSADDDENNGDMEDDILFEGCEEPTDQQNGDEGIVKKASIKKLQTKNSDSVEDNESLYADSEFAEAIAKAAETSASVRTASSKLKSSEISKLNHNVASKRKRPEGVIRPSFQNHNHPMGGRLAPTQDDMQVKFAIRNISNNITPDNIPCNTVVC